MNMKDNIPILSDEELDAVIGLYMEGLLSRQEERALAMMLMEREPLTPSMESALVQMGLESVLGRRKTKSAVRLKRPWYLRGATGWSAARRLCGRDGMCRCLIVEAKVRASGQRRGGDL